MFRNKIFIFFLFSFFVWVFAGNILFDFALIVIFLCIVMMFLIVLLWSLKKHHLFLFFIWFWIVFWWLYSWVNNYFLSQKKLFIEPFYNQSQSIIWEIESLYKKSSNYNSYVVKIYSLNDIASPNIYALMYYPKNYILEKWDILSFESKITQIDNFTENFNYKKFLQSKNIYFQLFVNNVDIIEKKEFPKWRQFILDTRKNILDIVYNMYPKDEAVFLAGILIGAREDMDEELSNNFNNSWLTHLVAVSGFNITIIIIFLWFLLKFFPVFIRTFIICVSIIFFVLLVWDNVPVVRAWIMWLIGYFIIISGRKADSLTLLLFTAFVMTLYNPLYLNYDSSFHLSFLAVVGLLYFQTFWTKIFFFLPSLFAIKESFVLTMSALTTTLPIMIFSFGQLTFFAPITNMLVWWVIPFAMLFWFLSVIGQIFSSTIGFIFWFINYFFLKYVILVANYFWSLEFWVIKIDFWMYSIYLEILYFFILIFLIIYFWQQKNPTQ